MTGAYTIDNWQLSVTYHVIYHVTYHVIRLLKPNNDNNNCMMTIIIKWFIWNRPTYPTRKKSGGNDVTSRVPRITIATTVVRTRTEARVMMISLISVCCMADCRGGRLDRHSNVFHQTPTTELHLAIFMSNAVRTILLLWIGDIVIKLNFNTHNTWSTVQKHDNQIQQQQKAIT